MTRLYEIAALAYGLFAMTLLTGVALWIGDRSAALLMIGCVCAAYVCQCMAAFAHLPATKSETDPAGITRTLMKFAVVAWAVSILFALAAIAHMVLA